MGEEDDVYMGVDLSTQSCTIILLSFGVAAGDYEVKAVESVSFDECLPHYNTKAGMHVSGKDLSIVTSPVTMWLDALDMGLVRLVRHPLMPKVKAVSFSGQQHGTVYWKRGARQRLQERLQHCAGQGQQQQQQHCLGQGQVQADQRTTLKDALEGCFSRRASPIWADSSTTEECDHLQASVGGAQALADATGSKAYCRFSGLQIRKIANCEPDVYSATERVALVSSFLPSLFLGDYAPIDCSDASGMNLMDIRTRKWYPPALAGCSVDRGQQEQLMIQQKEEEEEEEEKEEEEEPTDPCSAAASSRSRGGGCASARPEGGSQTAEGGGQAPKGGGQTPGEELVEKLGIEIANSHATLGTVCPFFVNKYGLPASCVVTAGSGDNPCSIAGLGLLAEDGQDCVAVSLGTSDTVMGVTTSSPRPQTEGHVMVSPLDPTSCFAMLVYKNGAVARGRLRDEVCGGSWEAFGACLEASAPGNGGKMGLYLDLPEITPEIGVTGRFRRGKEGEDIDKPFESKEEEVRAVVEGRFLSMRRRLMDMGIHRPTKVLATGGGGRNKHMMQVLADVFGVSVFTAEVSDSAAVGAALRAKHGYLCLTQGGGAAAAAAVGDIAAAAAAAAAAAGGGGGGGGERGGIDEEVDGRDEVVSPDSKAPIVPFSRVVGTFEQRGLMEVARGREEPFSLYTDMLPAYHQLELDVQRRSTQGQEH